MKTEIKIRDSRWSRVTLATNRTTVKLGSGDIDNAELLLRAAVHARQHVPGGLTKTLRGTVALCDDNIHVRVDLYRNNIHILTVKTAVDTLPAAPNRVTVTS